MKAHSKLSRGRALIVSTMLATSVVLSAPAHARTYWYETYQRAVELIERGRSADAAPLVDRLIQEHPVPVSGYMLPGERFIDYLPYYQRARIQLARGDAAGAASSLDICEGFGAILRTRRSRSDLERLRREIAVVSGSRALGEAASSAIASSGRTP